MTATLETRDIQRQGQIAEYEPIEQPYTEPHPKIERHICRQNNAPLYMANPQKLTKSALSGHNSVLSLVHPIVKCEAEKSQ